MEPTQQKRPIWPFASLGSLFFVAVLLIMAWNIELPYLAYSPGPVANAIDDIAAAAEEIDDPAGNPTLLTSIG